MKEVKVIVNSVEEMMQLGSIIASISYPNLVIGLNGDLGAGKTVFTKGIGKYLGIKSIINSPTFTIMKIYQTTNANINKLYHLDVYRLVDSNGDFDLEEYFYLDGLTVIEWSNIIKDILPDQMWNIDISRLSDTSRLVNIKCQNDQLLELLKEANYEIIY